MLAWVKPETLHVKHFYISLLISVAMDVFIENLFTKLKAISNGKTLKMPIKCLMFGC
jgi:hypothetical protein